MEEGLVTLVGATTENPYFEVNSALLSRCACLRAGGAGRRRDRGLLRRALSDQRGLADPPEVSDEALAFLAARSGGDARTALAALELAARRRRGRGRGGRRGRAAAAGRALRQGRRPHYDMISAWIKATRGSDPDASLLYLAVMLEGGEDPRFIARRMVILASEDIGNADPAGAAGGRGRGPCRGARRAARVRPQPRAGGGVPVAGAEVQRVLPGLKAAPARGSASTGAQPAAACAARLPGAKKLGRGEGYDSPHGHPEGVSDAGADAARRRRASASRAVRPRRGARAE